jgi:hypothetical protein
MNEDPVCAHGRAFDMHCCDCRRSGFFPPDDCTCYDLALAHDIIRAERRARWRFDLALIGICVFIIGLILAVLR